MLLWKVSLINLIPFKPKVDKFKATLKLNSDDWHSKNSLFSEA